MDTWKIYIENKFVPKSDFSFNKDGVSLIIIHNLTGTSFYFLGASEDWTEISDVQFHNDKTKGWSDEFDRNLNYSTEAAQLVDNFLKPAFETGWTSKDIFLFGKHFKSIVSLNLDQTGSKFKYYSSELGCLSIILLPLFEIFSHLFGKVKIVKIPPIHSSSI